MLTLVAVVLAYDIARETCDFLSSAVEVEDEVPVPRAFCPRSLGLSLKDRSCTRLEKDMIAKIWSYRKKTKSTAEINIVSKTIPRKYPGKWQFRVLIRPKQGLALTF